MKTVIRMLISAVISSFVYIFLVQMQLGVLLPDAINGPFNYIYQLMKVNIENIAFGLLFVIVFFIIAPRISDRIAIRVEASVRKYTVEEILIYIVGLAIGLGMGNLMGVVLSVYNDYDTINLVWTTLLYVVLGYGGVYIAHVKREEIKSWFHEKSNKDKIATPKILDTSVMIDGRIVDIIKTGFVEGRIVIPTFVLDELRTISDSSDKLKREKGRRGLDLVREIQSIKGVTVEVVGLEGENGEVDSSLLVLAQQLKGIVVTNDFNLNKVAQVQNIVVLNVNELANAVKPVLLPNEQMHITIIKEGKERDQGIAYLNDGTMIVVEGGKNFVGQSKNVIVTKVLQTSAGRMIFAKINI